MSILKPKGKVSLKKQETNSEAILNGKVTEAPNSKILEDFWRGKKDRSDETGRGGQTFTWSPFIRSGSDRWDQILGVSGGGRWNNSDVIGIARS